MPYQGEQMNPLIELKSHGQSFWYDNIRRKHLQDGTISRLITEEGLMGMTSNPSIFEKAISTGDEYDEQIQKLFSAGNTLISIYETLAIDDIRAACDLFAGVYKETGGVDGYVSLEVSPELAHIEDLTVSEAGRLFEAVDRPNLMIKVPATPAGVSAFEKLIAKGININVTLMFSIAHYEAVAEAYIKGLTKLVEGGGDPSKVASVASFFVSRVDTAVDQQLSGIGSEQAASLLGKTAVANSKLVYSRYKEIFHGKPFEKLGKKDAKVQRLLWASTSTKNPEYSDTLYVDELIGPETVNTMPPATVEAFKDHGKIENTLEKGVEEAGELMRAVADLGIDIDLVTQQLQERGVAAFSISYNQILAALVTKLNPASEPVD
jgi:transaldolase